MVKWLEEKIELSTIERGSTPESFTDPCAGYVDHPFLKTRQMKETTRRSENELVDRVCLSRWPSCR
jgi:hypothetical protein